MVMSLITNENQNLKNQFSSTLLCPNICPQWKLASAIFIPPFQLYIGQEFHPHFHWCTSRLQHSGCLCRILAITFLLPLSFHRPFRAWKCPYGFLKWFSVGKFQSKADFFFSVPPWSCDVFLVSYSQAKALVTPKANGVSVSFLGLSGVSRSLWGLPQRKAPDSHRSMASLKFLGSTIPTHRLFTSNPWNLV